jgi:hypothetical protein
MAKLPRVFQQLFGLNGDVSHFGEFGSRAAGSPVNTKDPLTIQALAAFINNGWLDAINAGNKAPFLEDMNALHYLIFRQLCSIFQDGVPAWDSSTAYYTGSIVRADGTANAFYSLTDNNVGNALPAAGASNGFWAPAFGQGGQEIQFNGVTYTNTNSGVLVPTVATGVITPKSITSRVKISIDMLWENNNPTNRGGAVSIFRGSTNLHPSGGQNCMAATARISGISASTSGAFHLDFIDSPATLSPVTYTLYGLSYDAGNTMGYGYDENGNHFWNVILKEIGAT